jgi:hypothetical protein
MSVERCEAASRRSGYAAFATIAIYLCSTLSAFVILVLVTWKDATPDRFLAYFPRWFFFTAGLAVLQIRVSDKLAESDNRWIAAHHAFSTGRSDAPTLLNTAIVMDPLTSVFSFLRIDH